MLTRFFLVIECSKGADGALLLAALMAGFEAAIPLLVWFRPGGAVHDWCSSNPSRSDLRSTH